MFNFPTIFFLTLISLAVAAVDPSQFGGDYNLQHGDCPKTLTLLANSTTVPAATVILSPNITCSGRTLTLKKPTKKDDQSFISFLDPAKITDFYTTNIQDMTCGNITVRGPIFILRPDDDFTLPKQALTAFPQLNESLPNGVILSDDYIYIFVQSCIYKRKAPENPGIIDNIVTSISECLPADSKVRTQHAETAVEHMLTGDSVLSSNNQYTDIIAWTHRDPIAVSRFIKISLTNTSVSVTPGHYVYADGMTLPARMVKPGMAMKSVYGNLVVKDVGIVWKRGLYNPQTITGSLVVNGVVISTYTEAIPPSTAHALLAPVRMAYNMFWRSFDGMDWK